MAINYASKASPKVVEAFSKESVLEGIFNQDYDWTGVATVRVYRVDDLPLQDYNATLTTGSRFGPLTELGDKYQEMTVSEDKSFNGAIDKRNNTSTLMIKAAGKVTARQTRNVVIPYMDKRTLVKIAKGNGVTGFGGVGGGIVEYGVSSLTKTNIIETLMSANAQMSNRLVPKKNRVLYIGETTAIKVKLADQIVGTGATVQNLANKILVNGEIGTLDQMHICIVPDDYMPPHVVFMIVAQGCVVRPKKIETLRIIEDHPDIDGHVVQGRYLWDCFVLEGKADGIYVAKDTTATAATITLSASSKSVTVGTPNSDISVTLANCAGAYVTTDDEDIATGEITSTGYVKITATAAGTCTLTVHAYPNVGYGAPTAKTIAVTAS